MCGISGIVSPGVSQLLDRLQAMIKAQHHRGPDDEGYWAGTGCAFGHNRLSIVDLGGGHQPMHSPDGQHTIVFNGEIYGYRDLKRETPYSYRTESDTEVILACYARWGTECIDRIPGMFAFAIWDQREQTLFAARDRFGEKPFFYALTANREFIFASEIKAILASGLIEPEIAPHSIAHYLSKLYVHPHHTIYKNIHVLPPAHALTYRGGELKVRRYWQLPRTNERISLPEASEQFSVLLEAAVRKQMVADVPVAAFLSGGLDSSTIVGRAVQCTDKLTTLSYRFPGGLDEGAYARAVAEQCSTQHIEMGDGPLDIADLIVHMATVYDEPFGDSSSIPTYLISKKAREYSTVVLTGDGGDELLGGYISRYRPMVIFSQHRNKSRLVAQAEFLLFGALRKMLRRVSPAISYRVNGVKAFLRHPDIPHGFDELCSFASDAELAANGFSRPPMNTEYLFEGSVNDAMKHDILNYLPGDILVKTDRAAMAHGLELRAPFLDVELAEFLISLPSALKIDTQQDKILLRSAFGATWPQALRNRGKQGFGAPVNDWMKLPKVLELERARMTRNSALYNHLPHELVQTYATKSVDHRWAMLVLAIWLESTKKIVVH